jgi:hypothetical protein
MMHKRHACIDIQFIQDSVTTNDANSKAATTPVGISDFAYAYISIIILMRPYKSAFVLRCRSTK